MPGLQLAYIGDAVYEVYVREFLLRGGARRMDLLHKTATRYTRASAQSALFRRIEPMLTSDELDIYKRGRNTNSHVPKNADMTDYRVATGFEALIGYLYINGETARLDELMRVILR